MDCFGQVILFDIMISRSDSIADAEEVREKLAVQINMQIEYIADRSLLKRLISCTSRSLYSIPISSTPLSM